jgi:hypothetical protein
MFLASAALAQQDDLSLALNAFAADYNAFVEALRAGTFDLRTAKRLNKRWQRIQDCGEWPR